MIPASTHSPSSTPEISAAARSTHTITSLNCARYICQRVRFFPCFNALGPCFSSLAAASAAVSPKAASLPSALAVSSTLFLYHSKYSTSFRERVRSGSDSFLLNHSIKKRKENLFPLQSYPRPGPNIQFRVLPARRVKGGKNGPDLREICEILRFVGSFAASSGLQ